MFFWKIIFVIQFHGIDGILLYIKIILNDFQEKTCVILDFLQGSFLLLL
jgi:hypothetical protein